MRFSTGALFEVEATVSAWRQGDAWPALTVQEPDAYRRLLAECLPETIGYRLPEATCLAWPDLGGRGAAEQGARPPVSDGELFGQGGENHVRLDFGTSVPTVAEILDGISRLTC
ncbi:hypothetical protein [Streptosporangium sp. NPDC000396]|uniref:hypothetical protein n=1 Tax=Streptosporangium sp. NPDC000396 TaxID=3366185 RepID=UPI0036C0E518